MTLNLLQLEMVHCTLLQASEWESACDMPLVCGCLCFASGLYVGRGTFALATFQSLAGVVHVECVAPWVVEGSKGIT